GLAALLRCLAPARGRASVGRAGEDPPPFVDPRSRVAGIGAVLREIALDRERRAEPQGLAGPALARQRVRRAAFALPRRHRAVLALHVEVDPDVRVAPFDLGYRAFERDRLGGVELRGKRMMSERRRYRPEREACKDRKRPDAP